MSAPDSIDVLEAILRGDLADSVLLKIDEKNPPEKRFSVSIVHGASFRSFDGATLAAAVEQWRTFKLQRYERAVEVLRR